MTEGVLFDLDGVLIDSEGLYTGFWQETEALYPTGIADFAHFIKGSNLGKILGYFPAECHADILSRIHRFDSALVYPFFPGAEELLRSLAQAGIPAVLVTSSDEAKMQRLFSLYPHFSSYFHTIINGEMVTHSKPHPEGYLKGAAAIGVDTARCVVVEDSLQGIRAGKAAGATVVGVATTMGREAVAAEQPALVIDTIAQLSLLTLSSIS